MITIVNEISFSKRILTTVVCNKRNMCFFYVLLTVHPGMILVNNRPDAQFFLVSDVWLTVHRNSVWIRKTN